MENISQQVHSKLSNYYQVKNVKKFAFVILVVTVNSNHFFLFIIELVFMTCMLIHLYFSYAYVILKLVHIAINELAITRIRFTDHDAVFGNIIKYQN